MHIMRTALDCRARDVLGTRAKSRDTAVQLKGVKAMAMNSEVVNFAAYRKQRDKADNTNLLMFPFQAWIAYVTMGAALYDIWQADMRAL